MADACMKDGDLQTPEGTNQVPGPTLLSGW